MSPPGLRIAVDARPAAETLAGRGRYVRELLRALARLDDAPDIRPYGRFRPAPGEPGAGLDWRTVSGPSPVWPLRAGPRMKRDADVVLASASYLLAAATGSTPCVPVVYDLVPFHRELRPPRGALAERLTLPLAVRRAPVLVAISQAMRDELVARFPAAAGRTHVVTPAADDSFRPDGPDPRPLLARHGIDRPYVLVTGTLEPRKNLPRLIQAWSALPAGLRERHRLVVAGLRGWAAGETEAALRELGDGAVVLGFVPDDDLPALYRAATLFCYPSLHEGFGLPVLEALQSATPVLTSNLSSLPEVGGEAAAYADPRDPAALGAALRHLLEDASERQRLARLGPDRASQFSWEGSARALLDILRAVTAA